MIFGSLIALIFGLVALIVVAACFVFWIFMLVDVINNRRLKTETRILWFVLVLFLHIFGALIYYFVGRRPNDIDG